MKIKSFGSLENFLPKFFIETGLIPFNLRVQNLRGIKTPLDP